MKTLAIIPSRYASTRFPGKPLVDIAGKSMIQRVYEKATLAGTIDEVIVATDDQRIYDHVSDFGGKVMMTATRHQSGTERCGEVSALLNSFETVVNIQGDEPFIPPEMIDELVFSFQKQSGNKIATLVKPIEETSMLFNPNVVKVVLGKKGNALYFSRQPIPFQRGVLEIDWLNNHTYYKHIGIYAFHRKTLENLVKLPLSSLEQSEQLEQLRWLENGYSISAGITQYESRGIDTPEDLSKIQS